MPSILSDDDKQTVKRTVPKASNKIHAVAVAKLYIAYPNRQRWQYTGLQGAAVLANDLVGNTFWIKLVDVSPSSRGVIWDQEIYDTFNYNQDRTFFHTFEGEDCMFGLSFADEKEAKQFLKKMSEREKNAHKNTRSKPFASGPAQSGYGEVQPPTVSSGGKSRFGGLFSRHNNSGPPPQTIIPPRGIEIHSHNNGMSAQPSPTSRPASSSGIDLSDPAVQAVLKDLRGMGITEDQIEEHAGFIKSYLEQNKATAAAEAEKQERAARAPPPPPPPAGALNPQDTGGSGRRGPPPAPPPSRRAATGSSPAVQQQRTPSPPREPSPPRPQFRVPPPIADAGKFANDDKPAPPSLPSRGAPPSAGGPPPPPRPPKTPLDDADSSASQPVQKFAVPPPFEGKRIPSGPPPPPARSAAVPPPPPPRENNAPGLPPPPPPRSANAESFADSSTAPPPPPLPPTTSRPIPPPPASSSLPPPPPPLPPSSAPNGVPPPPPPMPPRTGGGADAAPAAPKAAAPGRDGLLADIRGGARLKKVSDNEKRDRSGAMVPGSEAAAPAAPAAGATNGGGGGDAQGGLAGALASALAARKSKVSHSDDEKDDDDW